ncbi:hypothetical protein CANMA_005148 [Candida margitis]|uniref:uncharacterized protein n=1 Tax=Candida margitis TaxID=1775924 RepID=UPI002225E23E|nr:uncharacterized protein CANMA_005148 [Candida margitis]KAI5952069.1 hypothetical protein CANMA_005148 [Candida margitis]
MKLLQHALISPFIIAATFSLNILLTSIDNWTSKDVRFLQSHLQQQGHNVLLIAPLYQENSHTSLATKFTIGLKDIKDGGEYGHLLPVHYNYYSKVSDQNQKRAKQVVFKEEIEMKLSEEDGDAVLLNNQYGQDPSNHNAWYVNCDAQNVLNIAMNVLIPKFYPNFHLDLVMIGPNQGLTHSQLVTDMIQQTNTEKVDAIAISTQDNHPIYYQDEKYFRIAFNDVDFQLSKSNAFTKNIKLIDRHVIALVDNLVQLDNEYDGAKSGGSIGLHLSFPSMNFRTAHCQTSPSTKLDYQVMMTSDRTDKHRVIADEVDVSDFELTLSGQIVEVEQEDEGKEEENSKNYASFRIKEEAADESNQGEHTYKKRRDAHGEKESNDESMKSTDYVLSNCNIAVTSTNPISSKKLKKLFYSD